MFRTTLLFLLSSHLMLGSPDVEKRLEDALDLITTNADWKAPAFGASLAEIISKGEDNQKLKTAGVLYIGHLQALDTATSLDRGADLAIQILNSAPLPIHDALASVQLASIRGLQGRYTDQLKVTEDALQRIEFDTVNLSQDKDLRRVLAVFRDR